MELETYRTLTRTEQVRLGVATLAAVASVAEEVVAPRSSPKTPKSGYGSTAHAKGKAARAPGKLESRPNVKSRSGATRKPAKKP